MHDLTARAQGGTLWYSLATLAALATVPFAGISRHFAYALTVAMIYAIAAIGMDLFSGYGGQLALGNFGFVALGAYLGPVLANQMHIAILLTLPIVIVGVVLIAVVVGYPMIRLPGLGIGLVTFFFAFVVSAVLAAQRFRALTGGTDGLAVPIISVAGQAAGDFPVSFYIVWVVLVIAALITSIVVDSRLGRELRLIKSNETVAAVNGVHVDRVRLLAFAYSAGLASVAGFLYAQNLGFLSSETFSGIESITLLAIVVVGGMGSTTGPILGALFWGVLSEFTAAAGAWRQVVFGFLLLAVLIFLPRGLFGILAPALATIASLARRHIPQRIRPTRSTEATEADITTSLELSGSNTTRVSPTHAGLASQDQTKRALALQNVSVDFAGVHALVGVNLTVRSGVIHALIGPNGSGKTTLLNCINRTQAMASGTIALRGLDITNAKSFQVRELGAARTFQHPSLALDLTPVENVRVAEPAYRNSAGDQISPDEALELAGLRRSRISVPAYQLSLSEMKMVDVARALAGSPDVLLMDEPTAGLDEKEIVSLGLALARIHEVRGITILLVAHHLGFVRRVAHQATLLDFGSVFAEGPPDELLARRDVSEVFVGTSPGD